MVMSLFVSGGKRVSVPVRVLPAPRGHSHVTLTHTHHTILIIVHTLKRMLWLFACMPTVSTLERTTMIYLLRGSESVKHCI
jgi:hypothetical protein